MESSILNHDTLPWIG